MPGTCTYAQRSCSACPIYVYQLMTWSRFRVYPSTWSPHVDKLSAKPNCSRLTTMKGPTWKWTGSQSIICYIIGSSMPGSLRMLYPPNWDFFSVYDSTASKLGPLTVAAVAKVIGELFMRAAAAVYTGEINPLSSECSESLRVLTSTFCAESALQIHYSLNTSKQKSENTSWLDSL